MWPQRLYRRVRSRIARRLRVLLGRELDIRPELRCATERHGTPYGGWSIRAASLTPASVVYSFGIGLDISFDVSLIERYGVTVHAFDPTPESLAWLRGQSLPESLIVHAYGIADDDGALRFYPPRNPAHVSHSIVPQTAGAGRPVDLPVRRLATIAAELGHRQIDLLKMDVEGAEYGVIPDILRAPVAVDQLLVEFHHWLPGMTTRQTIGALDQLRRAGYRVFAVSESGHECSLARI